MSSSHHPVALVSEHHASLLATALQEQIVTMGSQAELAAALTRTALVSVAFVDAGLLPQVPPDRWSVPLIAILDEPYSLGKTVQLLEAFPWLAHVVPAAALETDAGRAHLVMAVERLAGSEPELLRTSCVGRIARLATASKRDARIERIQEFFASRGFSARSTKTIADVVEELAMNALYDAPYEAGFFGQAIPRTADVELPPEHACEISYGIESGLAFVRVRDTFGALSRGRLLSVLARCGSTQVALDESRGGAGLGLWRVFSAAAVVAIHVVPGVVTDIWVGLASHQGRLTKQPITVHLQFAPKVVDPLDGIILDDGVTESSVTLIVLG